MPPPSSGSRYGGLPFWKIGRRMCAWTSVKSLLAALHLPRPSASSHGDFVFAESHTVQSETSGTPSLCTCSRSFGTIASTDCVGEHGGVQDAFLVLVRVGDPRAQRLVGLYTPP